MVKIDRHNYEEFYLDFLEGNLSPSMAKQMELFLSENPDLAIDEDLPSFSISDSNNLSASFKNQLKVTDLTGEINPNTIDDFLIADLEGQLSQAEKNALSTSLDKNPEWQNAQKLYAHTKLQPNLDQVYPDKKSLKQGRVIALRPIVSLLAAASVISFVWFFISPDKSYDLNHGVMTATFDLPKMELNPVLEPSQSNEVIQKNPVVNAPSNKTNTKPSVYFDVEGLRTKKVEVASIILPNNLPSAEIKTRPISEEPEIGYDKEDYALTMKDQAKPVTRAISDVIKQEVVYKKGTNTADERSGIYIKVGKFELYSNRKIKPKD